MAKSVEGDLKWCGEIRETVDHKTTAWYTGSWVVKSGVLIASSSSGRFKSQKGLKELSKLPPRAPTGCQLNIDFRGVSMSIRFKEEPRLAADLYDFIKKRAEELGAVSLTRSIQKSANRSNTCMSAERPMGVVRSHAKPLPVATKPVETSRSPAIAESVSRARQHKSVPGCAAASPAAHDENCAPTETVDRTSDIAVTDNDALDNTAAQLPVVDSLSMMFSTDSPLPEDKENRPNIRRPNTTSVTPSAHNAFAKPFSTDSFYGKNGPASQPMGQGLSKFDRWPPATKTFARKRSALQSLLSEVSPSKRRRTLTNANQIVFGSENQSPSEWDGWSPEKKDTVSASFQGFSNLGNTCYMNAILQAIFGVEMFVQQLRSSFHLLKPTVESRSTSLMRALYALLVQRGSVGGSERRRLLADVKQAISSDALRFSGLLQQDAHEFLAQVLDQLSDEWTKESKNLALRGDQQLPPNPVTSNFTFTLRHQIRCESCGNVVTKEEEGVDMALQVSPLRQDDDRTLDGPVNLQLMLDECLGDEDVEYKCELCPGRSSVVTHRFARLPRCLIVYAKRYEFRSGMARGKKIADDIDIPKYLTLSGLCSDDVVTHHVHSSAAKSSVSKEQDAVTPMPRSPLAKSSPLFAESKIASSRRQLFVGDSPLRTPLDVEDEELRAVLERSKTDVGGVWDDARDVGHGLLTEDEQFQMAINMSLACSTDAADIDNSIWQRPGTSPKDVSEKEVNEQRPLAAVSEEPVVDTNASVGDESDDAEVVPDSLPSSQTDAPQQQSPTRSSSARMSSIEEEAAVSAVSRKLSLRFEPVDSEWRRACADRLQLSSSALSACVAKSKEMSYDDRPTRTASIDADGNCLFRALSHVITLEQHSHARLRQLIVDFLAEYADTFRKWEGLTEDEWMAHLQEMAGDATWGTALELAAAATLLQTDLWTYYLNKWHLYRPRFPLPDVQMTCSKAIYLCNEHNHFEPVLQVSDVVHKTRLLNARRALVSDNYESGKMERSYRLSSVVSHIGSSSGSGHYISDVWDRVKNEWVECDDSTVGVISEEQVRRRRRNTGYIFIFTAKSICDDGDIRC